MATRIAVMNLGELQQVGSPQELYDHPANIFVAGFIGSPSMNLFEGTVRAQSEQLVIQTTDFTLSLPAEVASSLAPHEGRRLTFGIRPEHIHDPAHRPSGVLPVDLPADVEVMELMGNETFLHLRNGSTSLLARVDPRTTARTGERHTVVLDLSHLHAFDADTGAPVAIARGR